jgi:single-strand DNA-binding protein
MAKDLNQVRLKGHVGKEPELKTIEGGQTVVNFTLATNRNYKEPDQTTGEVIWKQKTEWHHITAWNKIAQDCARLVHRGSRIEIEGYINSSEWKAPDGRTLNLTEITAYQVDVMAPISSLKPEAEDSKEDDYPEELTTLDFNPNTLPEKALAS